MSSAACTLSQELRTGFEWRSSSPLSQSLFAHIEYQEAKHSYFGRVHIERNFIFHALLGSEILEQPKPLVASRGFPGDANLLTIIAWRLTVTEQETNRDRHVSRQEAERWVESGASQWVGTNHVTDPDFYRPSWLSTDELKQAYSSYLADNQTALITVEAALAAMQLLPRARLVYWFW